MKINWTQNEEIGDPMIQKDSKNNQFHFLNTNGISLANDNLEITMFCETMLEYNMDYMGLIEINLDTTNHEVQKQITEETKKRINQISVQLTSSNIPMENFYKPGGVLSICQGDFLT
jgi:hypothetical protein